LSTRSQNECKFGHWEELAHGGRCYWFEVAGCRGWKARYVKEVDANENTVRFWQEIDNDQDTLVEIHEKYPVDTDHRPVQED